MDGFLKSSHNCEIIMKILFLTSCNFKRVAYVQYKYAVFIHNVVTGFDCIACVQLLIYQLRLIVLLVQQTSLL